MIGARLRNPSNIEMRHIELIRSEKVLMANAQGELIFVRNVVDPEIVDQLDQVLKLAKKFNTPM